MPLFNGRCTTIFIDLHTHDWGHQIIENDRRFRRRTAHTFHPTWHDILNGRSFLGGFHLVGELYQLHPFQYVFLHGIGGEMLEEQLAVQLGVTRAFLQHDVLQVLGHVIPTGMADGKLTVTYRNDWPNQVVCHFVPTEPVAAGTARNCAVNDTTLQGRVHVGEGNELRVSAHTG